MAPSFCEYRCRELAEIFELRVEKHFPLEFLVIANVKIFIKTTSKFVRLFVTSYVSVEQSIGEERAGR